MFFKFVSTVFCLASMSCVCSAQQEELKVNFVDISGDNQKNLGTTFVPNDDPRKLQDIFLGCLAENNIEQNLYPIEDMEDTKDETSFQKFKGSSEAYHCNKRRLERASYSLRGGQSSIITFNHNGFLLSPLNPWGNIVAGLEKDDEIQISVFKENLFKIYAQILGSGSTKYYGSIQGLRLQDKAQEIVAEFKSDPDKALFGISNLEGLGNLTLEEALKEGKIIKGNHDNGDYDLYFPTYPNPTIVLTHPFASTLLFKSL